MTGQLIIFIILLFGVSLLSVLAEKIRMSYPILLVLAGLVIGFIPGIPNIAMNPDIVFLVFLPPLLYSAAWWTSWKDFWQAKRSISLLAFGLVFFTSTVIALVSSSLIPEFTLALGYLLGGIVSPPDAVAATSVMRGLKVPKRVTTILEGESLVNDASSLIVYRFALMAILTGQFSAWHATANFIEVAMMGIITGLAIAHVVYATHRFLPTTSSVDTAITLISPYFAYLTAEYFHYSGVLAVVSAGLFLSWRSSDIFTSQTRIQAIGVWNTLVFILNGVVFVLIGLQLPTIISQLGEFSLTQAAFYGFTISLVAILVRIIWVFPGAYLPRWLSHKIRDAEPAPGWQSVFIVSWSGMRGVVSLAAALALPLTLTNGEAFPFRNLILFITFCVIFTTLVVQGISLPFLIRFLKIPFNENGKEEEKNLRLYLAYKAIEHIEASYTQNDATSDALHHIKTKYEKRIDYVYERMLTADLREHSADVFHEFNKLQLQLILVERKELIKLRKDNKFNNELIRKVEYELDLEEAGLNNISLN